MRTFTLCLQTFAAIALVAAFVGCNPSESAREQLLGQGCTVNGPDPRACDPADTQKTTICHIPPGNPANAHTICVGNAAVPAHLDHGDFAGTCICTPDGGVPVDDAGVVDGPAIEIDGGAVLDGGIL
ncbi:MAG TPA: hypothetical protein VIV40_44470 [Kofleriaceae bacterium]